MDSSIPSHDQSNKEKKIAIIGAGISGLLACKHAMEKGFNPIVFESRSIIGGVWFTNTLESTRLQSPRVYFQFTDFPWPSNSVSDTFPTRNQVRDYIQSYALHFGILPRIKFNSKVVSIDYLSSHDEEMSRWSKWGGNGEAFSPKGKWNVTVQDVQHPMDIYKVYQVDFVILCVGKFSDLPNIPDFRVSKADAGFKGEVIHSMDYSAMDKIEAKEFIENKRVTVIGSMKSALDIAAEVAKTNGFRHPCTLVARNVHWSASEKLAKFIIRNLTRFFELMIHKPDEGFILWFLAAIFSPLRQLVSKIMECYLKWTYPLKKYDMVPNHALLEQTYSCMFTVLPEHFYDRVKEGSLLLKKSRTLGFNKNGLILDNETDCVETDIVILATGYKGDEKLSNLFTSIDFKKCMTEESAPLYRECLHPRIPQLAILGYSESATTLFTNEMRSKWIANFVAGKFKLPSINEMEENVAKWEMLARRYCGEKYRRSCTAVVLQTYCNDEICKDIGCNPKRKKTFFSDLFSPYYPPDYANL